MFEIAKGINGKRPKFIGFGKRAINGDEYFRISEFDDPYDPMIKKGKMLFRSIFNYKYVEMPGVLR